MNLSRRTLGFIEILVSGICFGFLGVFGKWAYEVGLTPGELLAFRFTLAAAALGVFLLFTQARLLRLSLRQAGTCAALGILGYAVFSSFYFLALQGPSASLTVLLLYLYPVIVTVGARVLFQEKMGLLGWLALPIASTGLALLVWGDMAVNELSGLMFGVLSAVFYSAYILASRGLLKKVSPITSCLYIQLGAGIALAVVHLHSAERVLFIAQSSWLLILGISVVSTTIPIALFLSGLQKLSSAEASILSTAEPVTGILVAAWLLGERLSVMQLCGGALVLTAMLLIAMRRPVEEA